MDTNDVLLFGLLIASILPLIFRRYLWVRVVCSTFILACVVCAGMEIYVAKRVALLRLETAGTDPKTLTFFDGCYAMQNIMMPCLSIMMGAATGLFVLALCPRVKEQIDPDIVYSGEKTDPA